MGRMTSRNDTALHRNVYDRNHPIARGARLARHLVFASTRPTRALQALLFEVERLGCPVCKVVKLRAKTALDGALPYLEDQEGAIWK